MGKYWVGFTYDMDLLGNSLLGFIMIFWRGEGSRRAGAGLRFAEEWAAEEILDQVGGRLAAGVALCKALGARLPGGGVPFL